MLSHVRLRPRGGRLGWSRNTSRPSTRNFSQHQSASQAFEAEAPVRILRPTAWSAAAVGTIYLTCAAYEVRQDAKKYSEDRRRTLTFEQIENDRASGRLRENSRSSFDIGNGPIGVDSPRALWDSLNGPAQVMVSMFGINAAALSVLYMPPGNVQRLFWGELAGHVPVEGFFRYRQLLTSTFAHTGVLHFSMNMLVMFNFGSSLAHTPVFKKSGSHTLAFYLSSGIIASLGNHISTRFWPNKFARFVPALGFSGVVSAIFAAWCVENSDARVGIMFLPFNCTARNMLEGVTGFEILGVLGAFRALSALFKTNLLLSTAHAAHLTGLLFGASYVAYGYGEKLWTPSRRVAFRSLKSIGLI
ncbi:hypothetical protein N0V82_001059 [Gnomoniopsis sp. IMI 355080]|nr:hypothetical protein N0V82_001059 [Gnomoniopsis sp. IMI 355080]